MISIIIPIYNCEKYIQECLDSINNQTSKNYEVVIVDDGSTDNSYKICVENQKKNKKIKLFKQQNKGVSSARNRGIKNCSGKYIMFIDADDYIQNNTIETILSQVENDTLLTYGFTKKYRNKEIQMINDSCILEKNEEIIKNIFMNPMIGGYICNKIYIKSIIDNNNICFDSEIHYSEDLQFCLQYIKHCNRLKNINKSLYYYRMRKSSASFDFKRESNKSILKLYEKLLIEYANYDEIVNYIKYQYLIAYYKLHKIVSEEEINKDILKEEKNIINKNNLTKKEKMHLRIYKYSLLYVVFKRVKNIFYSQYE